MNLPDMVDIRLKVQAGAYSFEAGNPRHEHEWKVWETVQVPEGKILIPGVISHSPPLVEHPELVAQRIQRFAEIIGRERVMAGVDCGFGTFAGIGKVDPKICHLKLQALVEGAGLASERLW